MMFGMKKRGALLAPAIAVGIAVALAGCASSDPLGNEEPTGAATGPAAEPIVIGSQDYYSNEIIAEIYAQALEANGIEVERDFRIGAREVYLPDVEKGAIDLLPEYTGNLLQYYDDSVTATAADDVYAALQEAVPDGLRVLEQSDATDQDSYHVTTEFSEKNNVTSLADLAGVEGEIILGGNSELETRPYGPPGLKEVYGATVGFTPIEDSGGPLTLKALQDNSVQLVDLYSADPKIAQNDLVTLDDPEGLFLASHVVPLASDKVTDEIAAIINAVSAAMSAEDLVALNALSVGEKQSADTIAKNWLAEENLS